jgi:hypothetical protein
MVAVPNFITYSADAAGLLGAMHASAASSPIVHDHGVMPRTLIIASSPDYFCHRLVGALDWAIDPTDGVNRG